MAQYDDTQTFPAADATYSTTAPEALLIIDANGGQVAVDVLMSDGTAVAVGDSPFTADESMRIKIAGAQIRCTPAGGAEYEWVV